jgi:hypothetical protein
VPRLVARVRAPPFSRTPGPGRRGSAVGAFSFCTVEGNCSERSALQLSGGGGWVVQLSSKARRPPQAPSLSRRSPACGRPREARVRPGVAFASLATRGRARSENRAERLDGLPLEENAKGTRSACRSAGTLLCGSCACVRVLNAVASFGFVCGQLTCAFGCSTTNCVIHRMSFETWNSERSALFLVVAEFCSTLSFMQARRMRADANPH